jgi:hypothetical protein
MPEHVLVQQDWYVRGKIFMLASGIRIVWRNKCLLENCSVAKKKCRCRGEVKAHDICWMRGQLSNILTSGHVICTTVSLTQNVDITGLVK